MHFNFKQFTNINKNKTFKKEYFQINPDKYWNLLLGIFFILVILGCVFGYYKFFSVNKALNTYTTKTQEQAFNVKEKNEINSLIEYFQKRESKTLEIKESKIPLVIDPSL